MIRFYRLTKSNIKDIAFKKTFVIPRPFVDAPTTAQATTAQADNCPGDNCPGKTIAQVRQLPQVDNCPSTTYSTKLPRLGLGQFSGPVGFVLVY